MDPPASQPAVFGVIGGYGAAGSVVVSELARRQLGTILIGGRDQSRAEALTAHYENVIAASLDVKDAAQLDCFCARCQIIINCAGPIVELGTRAPEAAFRHGCHYVDPGGFGVVLREMDRWQNQMRQQELSFVLSAGWIPGLSEVLVRYADRLATAHLENPGMLHLFLADSSNWSETGFRDIVWHTRRRLWPGLRYFHKGKARLPGPLRFTKIADLPAPLGKQRVYLYFNHELEQFALSRHAGLAAYIGNFSLRTLVTMGLVALLPPIADRRAARWVRSAFRRDHATKLKEGFAVVQVRDRAQGSHKRMTAKFVTDRHYWITGLVPALVAAMLAERRPVERGAHFLGEAVDSMEFMKLLAECGVVVDITVDEVGEK